MTKFLVEICLISARGLRRPSSLWKFQWFAVGWIDPKSKYCTKIDTSGSTNPTWRTKFSALVDDSESKWQDVTLHVQVYSRGGIFLKEKLQGTSVVALKEFLAKYSEKRETSRAGFEQVGSYQLRRSNDSGKAHGFVDVSIRISEEDKEMSSYYPGNGEGFHISTGEHNIPFSSQDPPPGPGYAEMYPPQTQMNSGYNNPRQMPYPPPTDDYYTNTTTSSVGGPSDRPPRTRTPPPPPPPSHVGYLPTLLPGGPRQFPSAYVNIPSSSSGTTAGRYSGFGVGTGAGALAAGAVLFGDDFMSGFELPSSLIHDETMDPHSLHYQN